jgi:hypothetical protein
VGKWSQKSGFTTVKYPEKLISYIGYDLVGMMPLLWERLHTPFEKQDTRIAAFDSQDRSLYEVQKDNLYSISKNITCWLMS